MNAYLVIEIFRLELDLVGRGMRSQNGGDGTQEGCAPRLGASSYRVHVNLGI